MTTGARWVQAGLICFAVNMMADGWAAFWAGFALLMAVEMQNR